MVILGALIGVAAALLGQGVGSVLARRRDRDGDSRRTAARMLAHGRVVQTRVGNARALGSTKMELVELLAAPLTPFVEAAYELRWIAPEPMRSLVVTYQGSVNQLIRDWDVQRPGMLDDAMVAAGNALDGELTRLSAPRQLGGFGRRPKQISG